MPWMEMLYRTYEANAAMAGKTDEVVPLSLLAHMGASAQLEITIDKNGNFAGAAKIEKADARTIIPVTQVSASRTSGIAPHALCDTLPYIAGDFPDFFFDQKIAKKATEKFVKYLSELEQWVESAYTHEKALAVYQYVSQKCMLSDLIKSGLLACDTDGKVTDAKSEKYLVRFRILGTSPDACWQDKSLFDCYTSYYLSSMTGRTDICYLTGENDIISENHPNGIVRINNQAKLISANDSANFVFRGRFTTSEQATSVSYHATQKAHSALTWLVERQGVFVGTRTFLCWNPHGKEVIRLDNPFGLEQDDTPQPYTEESYKYKLLATLNGYRGKLDDNEEIVVIALDAATKGRLSVTYYNELRSSDFYDRIQHWGETCNWYFTRFTTDKKPYLSVLTPLTKSIVLCAFGTERGAFLDVDSRILKEQTQRIYSCMLDGRQIPYDIIHALFNRASNPQTCTRGNHERILSTACAMIAKYYNDKGVKLKMTLDYENQDRSYLFGRLLAVLEKAERVTFKSDEGREPNAIRFQSAYVNHPMSTWKILEEKLNPYYQKMQVGSRKFYKAIVSEIISKIAQGDEARLNRPLRETYLIGYYLQREELNKKSTENNKEEKSDEHSCEQN